MRRLPLDQLALRCQKLGHPEIGTWMARRVARPVALRITQVVEPWGVSANAVTVAASLAAAAAAVAFAIGTAGSWLTAAALLQSWYLLDHVDGQLARLRRSESLDGVALDYLMHHLVELVVPLGVGWGLAASALEPLWLAAGLAWALSLATISLATSVRYKAFMQRLKRLRGQLTVTGGAGGRPAPAPPMPRRPLALCRWLAAKACEMHVIMNVLALAALAQCCAGDGALRFGRGCLLVLLALAMLRAGGCLYRLLQAHEVEREFAVWFVPGQDHVMTYDAGWWIVADSPRNQPG